MTVTRIMTAALIAGFVGGCGVRGSLEAPQAAAPAATENAQAESGQGKKAGEAPKPHQGFILDGLLR